MKVVYILRAVPGAGKSTVADHIHDLCTKSGKTAMICCADDFFTDSDGNYIWDAERIGHAHLWCKKQFSEAIAEGINTIIVSNTNTQARDVKHYRNEATENGYIIFVITVENWHEGIDIHNVPDEAKERMSDQLQASIRLT